MLRSVISVVLVLCPLTARAGDFYVSAAKGDNGGAGTKEAPFKDIDVAAGKAKTGDTLYVAAGTYFGVRGKGYIEIKEPVTLLVIGPQTNLQEALKRDPGIAKKARIVAMAGSVEIGYNGKQGRDPEWNVFKDIQAARAVFRTCRRFLPHLSPAGAGRRLPQAPGRGARLEPESQRRPGFLSPGAAPGATPQAMPRQGLRVVLAGASPAAASRSRGIPAGPGL